MADKQKTLKREFTLEGYGLHTGRKTTITVKPVSPDYGYKFCRTDIAGNPVIDACADNYNPTQRRTTISKNEVSIQTPEHLLSALYANGIDNALIEIDGDEIPILDGSGRFWVEAIQKVGTIEQNADRTYYEVAEEISFAKGETKITVSPCDTFKVDVRIAYDSEVLSHQTASMLSWDEYNTEIANTRTFVFVKELRGLLQNNLIKGGTLDNAIVIYDEILPEDEMSKLKELFQVEVDTSQKGILNNIQLQYPNEPARHKLLDFIGDLSLCGRFVKGHFKAIRPGHGANCEFSLMLQKKIKL